MSLFYEFKTLSKFALPLTLSYLINSAASLITMYYIARLGADALASGAIITSTYGLITMMITSILFAVSIQVCRAYATNEHGQIASIFYSAIAIVTLIALPLTFILWNFTDVLYLLKQPKPISLLAGHYFRGIAFGFLPSLISAVYIQLFMGMRLSRIILTFTTVSVFICGLLSYLCIFGYGHFRGMGMFGAGLANSMTAWINLAFIISYTIYSSKFSAFKLYDINSICFNSIASLLKLGLPISVQYSTELAAFALITYLIGIVGKEALAAQQIAMQCAIPVIMFVMAVSQSGSILVSQALAKNQRAPIADISNASLLLGFIPMMIIAVIYLFFP